jgi:hypothetical protein
MERKPHAAEQGGSNMAGLMLTAEQIRNAPPEVRKWLGSIVDAEFLLDGQSPNDAETNESILCSCTPEEAAAVFVRIRNHFLTAQVMLELGRYVPYIVDSAREVVAVPFAEIVRRAGLEDSRELIGCLERIGWGFKAARDNPNAQLFGFDERGRIYFREATYQSLRKLWEKLVLGGMDSAQGQVSAPASGAAANLPMQGVERAA